MSRRIGAALAAACLFACASLPVVVGAQTALPATAAKGLPPINDFVRPTDFASVTLSPDGLYIAAIVPRPDTPNENYLAILDGKTARLVNGIPSGKDALITSYFWTDDNRLIISLAHRWGGEDTPVLTGELFAIDPDGHRQLQLFGMRAGKNGVVGPAGRNAAATPLTHRYVDKDEILIGVREFTRFSGGSVTEIDKLNVQTGKTTEIGQAPARDAGFVADHAGQVRVAIAENDYTRGSTLWLRKDNSAAWELANDASKSQIDITPIGFNRDNSKLYVRVSDAGKPDAIELLDMTSRQRTRLYQGEFADPGSLLSTADRNDYYAVETHDGRTALHYFNKDSDEATVSQALTQLFPGQYARLLSFTHDGKHAIVMVRSDRNPGDYYLMDMSTHNMQLMVHARPWVNPESMRPMEPVTITARDQVVLHGFLTTPAGPRPYPLVVLPHGGPHGIHDEWGFDSETQLLASRGYAVLQVNYRGSGGYGRTFEQMGYRQWGLSMQDDLTDATRWAIAQGYAPASRVCIYGGSYGGYAALEGAVREPELYRCAVGYAGVYDLRVQMDHSDTQRSDMGTSYLDRVLGTDRDDLLRRSPLGGVAQIKADVLLIHGEDDPRVPYQNFQEFTHALEHNGKHYETLVETHEGHGFFLPAHREAMYQKLLDFLDHNIGAGAPANTAATAKAASP